VEEVEEALKDEEEQKVEVEEKEEEEESRKLWFSFYKYILIVG
jgi:hypothetical protein